MANTPFPTRYSAIAILLHWLVALCVTGLLVVGAVMVWAPPGLVDLSLKFTLYQWHKSFGFTVFVLTVLRIVWRFTHKPPPLPDTLKPAERFFAPIVHYGLYVLLLVMPLAGWAVVSTASFNVPTYLFQTFHVPHIAFLANHSNKASLAELASTVHLTLAIVITSLIVVHIAAVLKHHLFDGGNLVTRMLPQKKAKRLLNK